ncbi:hypothetical protein FHETE_4431 [Fusarium heterosporum]|uniref:Uncharacterized protein n=1 Tax=Fusarium heterosporum TaxID=42747 RepID=A0A8H5TE58_FUSHE|nr:hypothetical protein FHETE_4431 [Fusarium heterosporum]
MHQIETKKSKTTRKSLKPTRVQPKRAAKDNHILNKANSKKRGSDEEQVNPETKRRKTDDSVRNSAKWKTFSKSLEQQLSEMVEAVGENELHGCPFGPTPWTCHLCTAEIAESTNEDSLMFIEEPTAPIARMSLTKSYLELNSWKDFGTGENDIAQDQDL